MSILTSLLFLGCSDDSFYTDPVADLAAREPGEVLRVEHIGHTSAITLGLKGGARAGSGAHVYRLLYRTTGREGEPDVASARLAVPDELDEDAPILGHLHGTVGQADRCAPSRDPGFGFESSVSPLPAWAAGQGWLVVEPDYLGLGPPGPHPYVARDPTAHSVLDALRAASEFASGGAREIALVGHSQGAHAVLSALASAGEVAPELPIVSAVALAAPGAPEALFSRLLEEDRWGGFVAMAVWGWVAAHPELGEASDWIVDERFLERLDEDCLLGLGGSIDDPPSELLQPDALEQLTEGFPEILAHEDLGGLATDVPLLVVHGTEDDLLPPSLTEAYVERMVQSGTDVTWLPIEGGDHLFLPAKAREEVRDFLTDTVGW
jgi:pimeloyl-ACP methyl ester carboxylesterase